MFLFITFVLYKRRELEISRPSTARKACAQDVGALFWLPLLKTIVTHLS